MAKKNGRRGRLVQSASVTARLGVSRLERGVGSAGAGGAAGVARALALVRVTRRACSQGLGGSPCRRGWDLRCGALLQGARGSVEGGERVEREERRREREIRGGGGGWDFPGARAVGC